MMGIMSGMVSAFYYKKIIDRIFSLGSIMGISVPTFWVAIILQYIFAYKLAILPISGFSSFKSLILPSIVLGWSMSGEVARILRGKDRKSTRLNSSHANISY